MIASYASDVPGYCRCYRCGVLLFNPDDFDPDQTKEIVTEHGVAKQLTVDRIIPGCQRGTYRRNNIRPACGKCNSETGAVTRSKTKKGKA